MHIIMSERDAGKKHVIMTILNSMSTSERKEFLNKIYGIYVDTDSIKVYNHCEELLYKIREAVEIDSARIDAQAETIQKLCKVIKFMLPYLNINPLSKKYDENIRKIFEDIYKEF